jgi:hypothetical protein
MAGIMGNGRNHGKWPEAMRVVRVSGCAVDDARLQYFRSMSNANHARPMFGGCIPMSLGDASLSTAISRSLSPSLQFLATGHGPFLRSTSFKSDR